MSVLAMDWNATRVRAVLGLAGHFPLPVPLEPPHQELPLAIHMTGSGSELGSAALGRCRLTSVCRSYLPNLGEARNKSKHWQSRSQPLTAEQACELTWRRLHRLAVDARAITLTLPGYVTSSQADALRRIGERLRLPIAGSMPTTLAAALAGRPGHFWHRSVLVIDADDHALTIGWVKALADRAHLMESRSFTQLGVHAWKERLIDSLSDRFIRAHRRDPRDVPSAEQSLFDQLDALAYASHQRRPLQLGVNGEQWYKHLLVHPDETVHFCQSLAHLAAREAEEMLSCWPASERPPAIILTQQAGHLPGLIDALTRLVVEGTSSSAETKFPETKMTGIDEDDFGENLMIPEARPRRVVVLAAEAPACAAHALVACFQDGMLRPGHVESIVPLAAGTRQQVIGSKD